MQSLLNILDITRLFGDYYKKRKELSMQVNQELPDMFFMCFSLGGSRFRVIKSVYSICQIHYENGSKTKKKKMIFFFSLITRVAVCQI